MCILTDLAPVRAAIGDDESSDIFGKSASSASSLGANSTGTSEGVDSAFGSGDPPPLFLHPAGLLRVCCCNTHASQVLCGCSFSIVCCFPWCGLSLWLRYLLIFTPSRFAVCNSAVCQKLSCRSSEAALLQLVSQELSGCWHIQALFVATLLTQQSRTLQLS